MKVFDAACHSKVHIVQDMRAFKLLLYIYNSYTLLTGLLQ